MSPVFDAFLFVNASFAREIPPADHIRISVIGGRIVTVDWFTKTDAAAAPATDPNRLERHSVIILRMRA